MRKSTQDLNKKFSEVHEQFSKEMRHWKKTNLKRKSINLILKCIHGLSQAENKKEHKGTGELV